MIIFDRVILEVPHENFVNHLNAFYPNMLSAGQIHEIARQLFGKMSGDFRHYMSEVQFLPNRDLLQIDDYSDDQVNKLREAICAIGLGFYALCNQHKLFDFSSDDTFPYFLEHVDVGLFNTKIFLHADHQVNQSFFPKGR